MSASKSKSHPVKADGNKIDGALSIPLIYTNELPDIPVEGRLLKVPRFGNRILSAETSVSASYQRPLIGDSTLDVNLDFIDMSSFVPANPPKPLDDRDFLLVNADISKGPTTTEAAQPIFLRKMKLLSHDDSHLRKKFSSEAAKLWEEGEDEDIEDFIDWNVTWEKRKKLIEEINASFEAVEGPFVHPTNKSLSVVSSIPIFPDEELFANPYSEVVFDSDPFGKVDLSDDETEVDGDVSKRLKKKRTNAIIRSFEIEGRSVLGYYIPTSGKSRTAGLASTGDGKAPEAEGAEANDDLELDALFGEGGDEDEEKEKKKDEDAMDLDLEIIEKQDIPPDATAFKFVRPYSFNVIDQLEVDSQVPLVLAIGPGKVSYTFLPARILVKPSKSSRPVEGQPLYVVKGDFTPSAMEGIQELSRRVTGE